MLGGLFFGLGASCALTSADIVSLPAREVQISAVASLDCLSGEDAARVSAMVIARLPRGAQRLSLSRTALAALVRRRVPMLRLGMIEDGRVVLQAPARPLESEAGCFTAGRDILADALIVRDDVEEAPCPAEGGPRYIRYDRSLGVLRAARDIAAGQPLGRMAAPPATALEDGERVRIAIQVGPVRIERDLEVVQSSDADTVFVRDDAGQVFAQPTSAIETLP